MTSPSTDTDTERLTAFHAAAERLAEQAPVLLRTALGSGGAEADLFLEASLYHRITLDGSLRGRSLRLGAPRVERHDVAGLGVRVRRGRAMGYAAAEGLDGTGWHAAAGRAAATFGTGRTRGEARATVHTGRAVLPPRLPPDAPETAGIPEKRILLETAIEAAFAFDERVVRARATYYDRTRRVAVHTSWGRAAATATMLLGLRVEVTLAAGRRGTGTRSVTACAMTGGACGLGHFFTRAPEAVAREAVERAAVLLEARPLPPGPVPVVLAAGWGGAWLHEVAGHAFEADVASEAGCRVGARVAGAGLTLLDDPTLPDGRGTAPFDDEATPTRPTVLVEDGVLCALLTDRACAETLGLPVTGHARRQDYRHAPLPRMTNLVLAPGAATPADLIAGVRDGLYVRTAGHGTLQPGTGTYTLEVVEGTRIEAGRLTHPVAGVRLEGRLAGALAGIRGVARDGRLETARGICEKAGQTVPVSVGMPTVLVEGMTVVSRSRL